jgi:hypothetical protein
MQATGYTKFLFGMEDSLSDQLRRVMPQPASSQPPASYSSGYDTTNTTTESGPYSNSAAPTYIIYNQYTEPDPYSYQYASYPDYGYPYYYYGSPWYYAPFGFFIGGHSHFHDHNDFHHHGHDGFHGHDGIWHGGAWAWGGATGPFGYRPHFGFGPSAGRNALVSRTFPFVASNSALLGPIPQRGLRVTPFGGGRTWSMGGMGARPLAVTAGRSPFLPRAASTARMSGMFGASAMRGGFGRMGGMGAAGFGGMRFGGGGGMGMGGFGRR